MEIISRKRAVEIGLKTYFSGVPCKNNHTAERYVVNKTCIRCNIDQADAWRKIPENKSKVKKALRKWIDKNRDHVRATDRKRGSTEKRREYIRRMQRERVSKSPILKSMRFMRTELRRVMLKTNQQKIKSTIKYFGYTAEELRRYIETKFSHGMNWENYGYWHIDHIVPVDHFLKSGITDPMIISALSNLQPLWARDNLIKGNKILGHTESR